MKSHSKRKVLLVGWDGADWQHIRPLMEEGLLPTLSKLIDGGVYGNLSTLQPVLSPMLWNSVATGKFADKHGILGFTEPDSQGGVRPFSSVSRKTKALWNIFSQEGLRSNVVNWWASHPAEKINGSIVSNLFEGVRYDSKGGWKISPGTIHPQEKEKAFAKFKWLPEDLSEESILPFVPYAAEIDQEKDKRLGALAKVLSETITTHSVATAMMESEPWDFMAIYYTGIDHFSHAFMNYHPPQMPNISDEDFRLYKDVIKGAYRFHDMMLERLLELSGEDTTVVLCSDHGFHSGKFRPLGVPREPAGPAVWHRQFGVLVMNGPGIKRGDQVYGASLIDIGPTILHLFDLPIGEDMDGRVLVEAIDENSEPKLIPSWDLVDGNHGMHEADESYSMGDSNELLKQFVALGYIDKPDGDLVKQVKDVEIEMDYNLARNLMWQKRYKEALPLLERISSQSPWEDRFILLLADCLIGSHHFQTAYDLLNQAYDFNTTSNGSAVLLLSRILLHQKKWNDCVTLLRRASSLHPASPGPLNQVGIVYLRMRKWKEAEETFRKVIEVDPDLARAHVGLAYAFLKQNQNQMAIESALNATELLYRLPKAHLNLGIALSRINENKKAIIALENAVKFDPELRIGHRFLFTLKAKTGDIEGAETHRVILDQLSSNEKSNIEPDIKYHLEIPDYPPEAERSALAVRNRPRPNDKIEKSGKTFVIVSGLPRSGTSMMMQILDAGGMSVLTDNLRKADVNNKRGYFEWEPIKQIDRNPQLLDTEAADGQAIKVISMLLAKLPREHDYRVIFMMRPVGQIAMSQRKMIENLDSEGSDLRLEQLASKLKNHRDSTLEYLENQQNFEYITIGYSRMLADHISQLEKIIEFVGSDKLSNTEKMISVIDPDLQRQKSELKVE